jgi:hypothetical protein
VRTPFSPRALAAIGLIAFGGTASAEPLIEGGGTARQVTPISTNPSDGPLRRDIAVFAVPYRVFAADRDALNRAFRANGFSTVRTTSPMFGIALDLSIHRFRIGVDVERELNDEIFRPTDGASAAVAQVVGSFDFGWDVYVDRFISAYPLIGLSFGGNQVTFDPAAPPIVPQAFAPYQSRNKIEADSSSFAVNWAAGFATFLPFSDPRRIRSSLGTVGLSLEARIGYLMHFAHETWREDENKDELPGLPTVPLEGPYGRLAIGIAFAEETYPACSAVCPSARNATAQCSGTSCVLVCNSLFGDCDMDLQNGCERRLDTLADCGGCGVRCTVEHGVGTCEQGTCEVAACNPGFMNCDGLAGNGCEEDLRSEEQPSCPVTSEPKRLPMMIRD